MFMCLAIAVNAINRESQEHKSESQDTRMVTVEATNDQILHAVLSPSPDVSEPARRFRVEEILRNRYILTHTDIAPEILAKTAWPPAQWMNQELDSLHEKWRFSENAPKLPVVVQQILPEPKKASVEFGFYTDAIPENITSDFTVFEGADSTVVVPFTFRVTGDVTAHALHIWLRVCGTCAWKEEPVGFEPPDKNKPTDRQKFVGDFNPGPIYSAIDAHIQLPSPVMDTFQVGGYFACDNCPPANKDSAQKFTVRVLHATQPFPLLVPYIPIPGPQ
jgi:hypothetical protein